MSVNAYKEGTAGTNPKETELIYARSGSNSASSGLTVEINRGVTEQATNLMEQGLEKK